MELKTKLLFEKQPPKISQQLTAAAILRHILKATECYSGIRPNVLRNFIRVGWKESRKGILNELATNLEEVDSIADVIATVSDEAAKLLDPSDVAALISRHSYRALAKLVVLNLHLLELPDVWRLPDDALEPLINVTQDGVNVFSPSFRAIIYAAATARNSKAILYFVHSAPSRSVEAVLDWLESRVVASRTQAFDAAYFTEHASDFEFVGNVLNEYGAEALAWFQHKQEVSVGAAAVVLRALQYATAPLMTSDRLSWLSLAQCNHLWDEELLIRSKSALLALAFRTPDPLGADLAVATFGKVHSALLEQHLPDASWRALEPLLPSVPWQEWDKAGRLRQGLLDRFIEFGWPLLAFAQIAPLVGPYLANSTGLRYRHRRFLWRFSNEVSKRSNTTSAYAPFAPEVDDSA